MKHGQESWLVVGGSRGTGLHLVNSLLKAGRRVDVVGRREKPDFAEDSEILRYHQCDLGQNHEVELLVQHLVRDRDSFSKVVFMQRYRGDQPDWDAEIEVCLTSTRRILDAVPQLLRDADEGAVALVGSVAENYVFPDQSASYHVTKAGLRQLVRFYAVALGPQGIRVNLVVPATILKDGARPFYEANPELLARKSNASPLGRVGTPEDIPQAIRFLCSRNASFITGQELVVDGGISLLGHEYAVTQAATDQP